MASGPFDRLYSEFSESHRLPMPKPAMLRLIRVGFVVYAVLLTLLLLASDPLAAAGIEHVPKSWENHVAHFVLFILLALLAHACRWPISTAALIGLLAVYAVAVEALQGLVPNRYVQISDFVENLLGVATPATVSWLVKRRRQRRAG